KAKEDAIRAKTAEEEAHKKTDRARKEAEGNLYYHSIALADGEWRAGHGDGAERVLQARPPPPGHRGGGELKRPCHTALSALPLGDGSPDGGAFSPDGKRFASAGGNPKADRREVKVWDVESGRGLFSFAGPPGSRGPLVFSGDGSRLAVAGQAEVKVWDLTTGRELPALRRQDSSFTLLALSPDGKRLAAVAAETVKPGEVILWDVAKGERLPAPRGHGGPFTGGAFSPDGGDASSGQRRQPRLRSQRCRGRVPAAGAEAGGDQALGRDRGQGPAHPRQPERQGF